MSANGSQTSKPCTKCYETKPLEDFHRAPNGKHGAAQHLQGVRDSPPTQPRESPHHAQRRGRMRLPRVWQPPRDPLIRAVRATPRGPVRLPRVTPRAHRRALGDRASWRAQVGGVTCLFSHLTLRRRSCSSDC